MLLLLGKKLRRAAAREEGASLVEVVLLLVILAIALVPLSRLAVNNSKYGAQYLMMTRAANYAQERMEEIIADYGATAAGRGYTYVINNWSGVNDTPSAGFSRSVSISNETTLNGVTYVTVTVSVSNANIETVNLPTILVK